MDSMSDNEFHWVKGPGDESFEVDAVLPVLPVRDVVVFPGA